MPSADAGGLSQLTAAELEFIAEDQLIEIVPKFKHEKLHLIQGDFGPFVPQARAKVPLWLAITLKKRQKCQIVCPPFMSVGYLEHVLRRERENAAVFTPLPHHYLEIASLLLNTASDDIEEPDRVRTLLEDVENVRRAKMYEGMGSAAQEVQQAVKVNDLGAMELLPVRSFFAEALASLYVVSGQKSADQRARDLEEKLPAARGGGGSGVVDNGTEDGDGDVQGAAAGLGAMEAAGEGQEPLRPRRVRRFAS
eukprot:g6274.t1